MEDHHDGDDDDHERNDNEQKKKLVGDASDKKRVSLNMSKDHVEEEGEDEDFDSLFPLDCRLRAGPLKLPPVLPRPRIGEFDAVEPEKACERSWSA